MTRADADELRRLHAVALAHYNQIRSFETLQKFKGVEAAFDAKLQSLIKEEPS